MSKQAKTSQRGTTEGKEAGRVEWDSGRREKLIQVPLSPIMACIFSQGPSASTFPRASSAKILVPFLFASFVEQTASKEGGGGGGEVSRPRPSPLPPTFFMARGKSLRSKSCGKTSSVEGTKKSNFSGGEGEATDISDTEREEKRSSFRTRHTPPRALQSIFGAVAPRPPRMKMNFLFLSSFVRH